MGVCQSQAVHHQEIEPLIIMWVLKVSDFLQMELPLPKHEELQAQGLLHRRDVLSYCIFVSHQWLSLDHPDPEGEQLSVLQGCLRNICDGRLTIRNDAASQFFGEVKVLSSQQRSRIRDGYIWLDWISIPQIETFNEDDLEDEISAAKRQRSSRTFAYKTPAKPRRTDQEDFILSIPSFVQACQVFLALVPPLKHKDSNQICNYSSWSKRGWCRTELWCKIMLGNQDMPMVVVSSKDAADFGRTVNWVDSLPHEGEFSVPEDRGVVNGIFEQALSHQLAWLEHEADLTLYRYFLARRESLIGAPRPRRRMVDFLEEFHYKSLGHAARCPFGPVAAAALSGDVDLVKLLIEARCSMEQRLKTMVEVGIVGGLSALHVVIMQGWRSPVLQILLEARANPNLVATGVPLLACCRTANDVELLVRYRADVHQQAWPLEVPSIALASGENTKPEVIAKLLECRASPDGPKTSGLGIAQPLALLSVNAKSNTYAMEIAELLLAARADVNQRCSASGLFYGVELFNRSYMQVAKSRSFFMETSAEWTTTPLGFASLFGNAELVKIFLVARGDANIKNARGHTPLQLAKSKDIKQLLTPERISVTSLPELEELDWEPKDWETPEELPVEVDVVLSARNSLSSGRSSLQSPARSSPGNARSSSDNARCSPGSRASLSPATLKKVQL